MTMKNSNLKIIFLCLVIFTVTSLLIFANLMFLPRMEVPHQTQEATQDEMTTHSPSKSPQMPRLILYWSTYFGRKAPFMKLTNRTLPHMFFTTLEEGDCPVPCEVSSNRSRANESSAFIVHARDPRPLPPSKGVPWILHTRENPIYTPILRNATYMSQFKLFVSYHLNSDFPSPSYPMPDLTPPLPFKEKSGIMATFSNCEKVRTKYMKRLMKYIKVDSYGSCLRNKKGVTQRYGKDFKQKKIELTRQYKFALVFMNQDCEYFVDDRLYHALTSGAVPVYMGTDKVNEFLPGNLNASIIKVRDFKNPKDLAHYLNYLSNNETAYNKYLEWKWKGFGDISDTVIGRYWNQKYPTLCQICIDLSKGKLHEDGLKPINCKPRRPTDWGI